MRMFCAGVGSLKSAFGGFCAPVDRRSTACSLHPQWEGITPPTEPFGFLVG
ncbi:MAG: hypothetical protein ABH950_10290 [Candidatus Altiarchaeota archaeon]